MAKSMTRPLIHIGYHRTGTTFFQQRFYPAVEGAAFVDRAMARELLIEPDAFSFDADDVRAHFTNFAAGRRLLICEENLSGYLHNGGFGGLVPKEVAHRLKAVFPDAQIVVFLRSQPAVIEASYAQYIRGGGTHSIDDYLHLGKASVGIGKYWYKSPHFSFDHFAYHPLLGLYRQLFGREAVSVHLYEEFAAGQREFLQRFARTHDLRVDTGGLEVDRVNASLTGRRLTWLRRLNLLTPHSVPDKHYLLDIKKWYKKRWVWLDRIAPRRDEPRRPLLSDAHRAFIDRRYADGNAQLQAEWDLPLANHGYPMPG
ncbi:hypothetical protein [Sphingomonas xanthus]|uniref:Sulfotransferase n=1 Tax=Sphingomonas xanthus TaxID=2594473 RepID=A0A516ITE4_9SPHN|nr:hypothetical protein [Sphingomonas xanthus]QDP20198.1 hypothetical protein FMM02_09685 [Sphingomonas xanthus]